MFLSTISNTVESEGNIFLRKWKKLELYLFPVCRMRKGIGMYGACIVVYFMRIVEIEKDIKIFFWSRGVIIFIEKFFQNRIAQSGSSLYHTYGKMWVFFVYVEGGKRETFGSYFSFSPDGFGDTIHKWIGVWNRIGIIGVWINSSRESWAFDGYIFWSSDISDGFLGYLRIELIDAMIVCLSRNVILIKDAEYAQKSKKSISWDEG